MMLLFRFQNAVFDEFLFSFFTPIKDILSLKAVSKQIPSNQTSKDSFCAINKRFDLKKITFQRHLQSNRSEELIYDFKETFQNLQKYMQITETYFLIPKTEPSFI